MKASSVLAFLAGGAVGAAAVYFTCTEKGRQNLKEGLDILDEKIKEAVGKAEEVTEEVSAE